MSGNRGARSEAFALWQSLEAEYERYQRSVTFIPTSEIRLQEDLRRYLCLRCAGFLEQVTHVVIHGHLRQNGYGTTLAFALSSFKHSPNLSLHNFTELLGKFGDDYKKSLLAFLDPLRRESLVDLMEVRNDVAHGKYSTGRKLNPDRYLELCEDTYDWLIDTFFGDSVEALDSQGTAVRT